MKPTAVVGTGVVGSRVARQLCDSGSSLVVFDSDPTAVSSLAGRSNVSIASRLESIDRDRVGVAVVATPAPQVGIAAALMAAGCHVVTTSDDPDDVYALLALHEQAVALDRSLVVGAATSPGMSGLLAAELAGRCDRVDEIHVAFHGTGGPACARQHHRSLGGDALGWHDGEWIERPGGSGRELLWFPEPIGSRDCYRAELADPIVLQRAFPGVSRISARVSATRRDRLTARLPMMSPPHAEGGLGALRVEVRGSKNGQRVTHVAGIAERTGEITGAVSAAVVDRLHLASRAEKRRSGAIVLGDGALDDATLVTSVLQRGLRIFEYIGSDSRTA